MTTTSAAAAVRPRVMIVSTNADRAGAPSHVRDLVLALADRYAFTVVFGADGPIRETLAAAGVPTRLLAGMRSAISPAADLQTIRALVRLIREARPDVIHAHSSKAGLVARIAGRLTGVPVVFTVHGWGFGAGRPRLQDAIVRITERLCRPLTAAWLAVSQADADQGRAVLGLPADRVRVVPNGVPDVPHRADPARTDGFVMVARTDHAKHHELALRAFARVATQATFTCVGGGTDEPGFGARAAEWSGSAAARVLRLGARNDIDALLAAAGVFVLASRYEGLPLSIIEAMRAGLPVVATRVGGVAELVEDGRTGLLVAPGDEGALAAALQRLADDPALRRRLGEAGRARYEARFTRARMAGQVAAVYDALAARRATVGVAPATMPR